MNEPAKNQGYFDPRALFVSPDNSGPSARDAQSGEFDPKAHYQNAWRVLKKAPLLFALKIGASLASAVLWMAIALLIVLPFFWVLGRSLSQSLGGALPGVPSITATVAEILNYLSQPAFLLGVFGLLAATWVLSLCTHAFASAGIWATLRRALGEDALFSDSEHKSLRGVLDLLKGGVAYFPRVLRLQFMVACTRAIVLLLGVLLLSGVWLATTRGVFAGSPVLARAFLWAWPLTLLSSFALLVRLSTEVAAAPMILDDLPVGRALLRGASFVSNSFVPVYRLFLYAAKWFLLPLIFYWGVLIAQNIVFAVPSLAPLFGVLRVIAFVVLFVASSIIAVFFKAAIFSYYQAAQSGSAPGSARFAASQIGSPQNHRTNHHASQNSTKGPMHKPSSPRRIKMTRETTLEDFLPDAYPNIIELSELIRAPEENKEEPAEPAGLKTRPGLPGFGDFAGLLSPKPDDDALSDDALSNDDIFDADDDPDS